jgi:hypothetical protein
MAVKNRLLTVLSEAEQYALYGLPDFDDAQRLEYLAMTETELALAASRPALYAQVYWGFSHKTAKFPPTPFKPLSIGRLKGKIDFRIHSKIFITHCNSRVYNFD